MRVNRVLAGLVAPAVFVTSARGARRPAVSEREATVFRWFNAGPDGFEPLVWAMTQAGSLGSVFVAAAAIERRRGSRDALAVLALGSGVWVGAKLIKPLVGRGRPDRHLEHVRVRGRPPRGLGYPSGHAAVSIALALIVTQERGPRSLAVAWASLVGGGRMYQGAHLPLDVAGGFALGTCSALAAKAVLKAATSTHRCRPLGQLDAGG